MQAYFQTEIGRINSRQGVSQAIMQTWLFASNDSFPKLECAIEPFGFTPRWGAMKGDRELNRKYCEISADEFAAVPEYDMETLTEPLAKLNGDLHSAANQDAITAKLFYSTRYLGDYDLDSDEFVNTTHPAIDYKMPAGTIVRAIGGGKVNNIGNDQKGLGLFAVVEHRLPSTGERVFSIYGHLGSVKAGLGQEVNAGDMIAVVGSSGNSKSAHLQLQIDRDRGLIKHMPYVPPRDATRADIARWTMHPADFIENY